MNKETFSAGVKHLVSVEPNFERFIPNQQIDFFVRPSGFEGICSLIIEQQISVKAANSIRKRVFGLMKRVCAHDFLANDPKYFKLAGLSGPKIKYLTNIAENILTGKLALDKLHDMSDEEAKKYLCLQKGIGAWTADCYLMASLGREDIWPIGDIGLQEGVRRLKDLKERPSIEDMTFLAREWRPFRSVAANLLWADYDI